MNKKVLHIISGDLDGGAARGAYWLHLALLDLNVDSKILTNSTKKYKDKRIYSLIDKPYLKVLFYFKFKLNSILLNFYNLHVYKKDVTLVVYMHLDEKVTNYFRRSCSVS